MKTLILLLLLCLPLCAATTYPMLSDTTNRTVTGGVTNLGFLNANQTFTGTNTFPAASFYPANMIGVRLLWSSPTNIFLLSVVTNATSNATNAGDFSATTYIAKATIPPLLGSNSSIAISYGILRTNANPVVGVMYVYAGSETNFVGNNVTIMQSTAGHTTGVFVNCIYLANSKTNQLQGSSFQNVNFNDLRYYADFSITNTLYFGATTTSSYTNCMFVGFAVYEIYAP